jgi:hypothetical protein
MDFSIDEWLKIVGVVGGAAWAIALLLLLRKRELARAKLRILELKAKQQAVVSIDIKPTVHRDVDGRGYIIVALVEIANRGSRNTRIEWKGQPAPFRVSLTTFDSEGKPTYAGAQEFRVPLAINPRGEAESHIIRAGGLESIPFALKVASAGLYLLSFRALVDVVEQPVAKELGAQQGTAWTCNRYVLVDDVAAGIHEAA